MKKLIFGTALLVFSFPSFGSVLVEDLRQPITFQFKLPVNLQQSKADPSKMTSSIDVLYKPREESVSGSEEKQFRVRPGVSPKRSSCHLQQETSDQLQETVIQANANAWSIQLVSRIKDPNTVTVMRGILSMNYSMYETTFQLNNKGGASMTLICRHACANYKFLTKEVLCDERFEQETADALNAIGVPIKDTPISSNIQ